jgi:hypothetical protein
VRVILSPFGEFLACVGVSGSATFVFSETIVSDMVTLDAVSKKPVRTVPVHARIPTSDVAEVDKAADEELVSRSNMLARIVSAWVKQRLSQKQKR